MLEWWPNLGKQDKIYFCFIYKIMYILFFSEVNNIPDGFSDNWKEAKFNENWPLSNRVFLSHGNNFPLNSFFFLAVPQTLCPVHVSQIDGFFWLLGRESCTLYWFVNTIQLAALEPKICSGLRHSVRYRIIWILSCQFSSGDADLL